MIHLTIILGTLAFFAVVINQAKLRHKRTLEEARDKAIERALSEMRRLSGISIYGGLND